jgi:hypothetical protein
LNGCAEELISRTTAAAATTTTATATTTVTTATATTAAAGTFLARARLINRQRPSFPILAIQALDRGFGALLSIHCHESEAAGTAGISIHYHMDLVDRSVWRKHVPKVVFSHVEGKVPDI